MKKRLKRPIVGILATAMAISSIPFSGNEISAADGKYKYVVMNIPYSLFYEAEQDKYNLVGLEQQTVNEVDAISTATTSKYKATNGLAKGTYYNTEAETGEIVGVSFPVKMTEEDYNDLKDTYLYVDDETGTNEYVAIVKGSYYFKDYVGEQEPANYKELAYSNGKFSFSEARSDSKDTSGLAVTDFTTSTGYGDYQVNLEGVNPGAGTVGNEKATVYGTIFVDSENKGYAMYALDNLWFSGRSTNLAVAFSVKNGNGKKRGHGSGEPFYQYDLNGKTLKKVILITSAGNYSFDTSTELTPYYTGDLSELVCSIEENKNELTIKGLPSELKDVKISVSGGLATNAEILNDKVLLGKAPVVGNSYTVTISSANYAAISKSVATKVSEQQLNELRKWIEKADKLKKSGITDDNLNTMEKSASEICSAPAKYNSADAAKVITNIITKVKSFYSELEVGASLKGNILSIDFKNIKLEEIENPIYKITQGSGRMVKTIATGDITGNQISVTGEFEVGAEYAVSVSSDNFKDSSLAIIAEVADTSVIPKPDKPTDEPIEKKNTSVTLKSKTATYSGKSVKADKAIVIGSTGVVSYYYYSDEKCKNKLTSAPKNAGTYYVKAKVAEDDNFNAATSKAVKIVIKKAPQFISKVTTSKNIKYANVKKKNITVSISCSVKEKAKISYKRLSGSKNIIVSSYGKITVKKGTKKGNYSIKIKVSAKETKNYKSGNLTKTIKIKVK